MRIWLNSGVDGFPPILFIHNADPTAYIYTQILFDSICIGRVRIAAGMATDHTPLLEDSSRTCLVNNILQGVKRIENASTCK